MRERISTIVERAKKQDHISRFYDIFISLVAFISITPLLFKQQNVYLDKIDLITVYILFLDYILRWIVTDFRIKKHKNWLAFIIYPFTPFAIMDLISILPSIGLLPKTWKILRMLRIFKVLHYSKNFVYISRVFEKEKKTLISVLMIALGYIFVSALAMFTYEPETFPDFFHALYWATTALTTVGYGDIYPTTQIGQLISMISSLFGIAVIAMPAGIVTAGFVDAMKEEAIKDEQD